MMPTFRIFYTDLGTGKRVERLVAFEDCAGITAREWAEDFANILSDKSTDYVVIDVKDV